MAAPTFVTDYPSAFNSTTDPKTVSVTTASGDVLIELMAMENNDGGNSFDLSTGGTGTHVSQERIGTINATAMAGIDSVFAGITAQTFTFSQAVTGNSSEWWGFDVLRFSGSDGPGAAESVDTDGAPSLNIVTTQANSALAVVVVDWNALDGASRTWRTVNSITPTAANGLERVYFRNSARYTVYMAYYSDVGAIGTKTVGLSAPTGQDYSMAVIEIKGSAASSATVTPGAIARSLTPNAATAKGAAVAAPSAIGRSFAVNAATVKGSAVAAPGALSRSIVIPAVTIIGNQPGSVAPDPIARALSLLSTTQSGGGVVSLGAQSYAIVIPAVQAKVSGYGRPDATAVALTLPLVTLKGGNVVQVGIDISVVVPAVTLKYGSVVLVDSIDLAAVASQVTIVIGEVDSKDRFIDTVWTDTT